MEANHTVNSEACGHATTKSHPVRNFTKHFFEMFLAMVVGMLIGGIVYWAIFGAASGMDFAQTSLKYPVPLLVIIALFMTAPMFFWMRVRGHQMKICWEMAAAMIIPVVPCIFLALFGILKGEQCGIYCIVTIPAMVIAMFLRRNEYSMDHRQHAHHEQVPV